MPFHCRFHIHHRHALPTLEKRHQSMQVSPSCQNCQASWRNTINALLNLPNHSRVAIDVVKVLGVGAEAVEVAGSPVALVSVHKGFNAPTSMSRWALCLG